MKGPEEKLTRKQESALVALLEQGTVKEAAKKCRMSESTLWRFMQIPEFQARYNAARRQLVDTAIARLQSASEVAVSTLVDIAQDSTAAPTARIAAARAIITCALRGHEMGQNGGENEPEHLHLCGFCMKKFMCTNKEDAEFEFSTCPVCKIPGNRPEKERL